MMSVSFEDSYTVDKTNDYNDYDNDCDEECLFLAEES